MPLPSFFSSRQGGRAWSVPRAAGYGAVIGAIAAALKTLGPLREAALPAGGATEALAANWLEIAGATLAFALLCGGAAALRNFIARRFIGPERP